jgi:hypothetical protein
MIQCRDTPHVANCLLSAQKIHCHLLNNIELLHLLLHLHNVHAACLQCGNTAIPALSITKKKSQVIETDHGTIILCMINIGNGFQMLYFSSA